MCMQVYDNANKISTIPRQCHPAAITQMVMDGLCYALGDVTQSERGRRPCLLVKFVKNITVQAYISWVLVS